MKKFEEQRLAAPAEAQTQKQNVAVAIGGTCSALAIGLIVPAYQAMGLSAAPPEGIGLGLLALGAYAICVPILGLPFPSARSEPFWHRPIKK